LVKTVKFKDPTYLGDPINIVRIFNDKEVDELVLLDIAATKEGRGPQFELLKDITSECFMPLAYGGGIRTMDHVRLLLSSGIEKIVLNTAAVEQPSLIRTAADYAGSQAVVISMDIRQNGEGRYEVCTRSGTKRTGLDPIAHARAVEGLGAGELFVNLIDRDGSMRGYDISLVRKIADAVGIPVVACGGAGKLQDLADVIKLGGASAAAAGSLFVFQGPRRAVLISYPLQEEIRAALET
jgi:cyclase